MRKYYISPLEKGYVPQRKSWRYRLILVMVVLSFSLPSFAFFGGGGISLGPLITIMKQVLDVSRQINSGIDQLQELENKTIGRIESVKKTLYSYTNLHNELLSQVKSTIYKVESLYQNASKIFNKDFWKNYGYGYGGLDRIIKYLDSVEVDKNGNIVRTNGKKASDQTLMVYTEVLSGGITPSLMEKPEIRAVIDSNSSVKLGFTQIKLRKTTVKKAVGKAVLTESTVEKLNRINERIAKDVDKGLSAGDLEQRKVRLLAINNRLLVLLNRQIAELIKISAVTAGYRIRKEEEQFKDSVEALSGIRKVSKKWKE